MKTATIEIKHSHGRMVLIATGRTGRGRRFIKAIEPINVASTAHQNFKAELAAAMTKLLGSDA